METELSKRIHKGEFSKDIQSWVGSKATTNAESENVYFFYFKITKISDMTVGLVLAQVDIHCIIMVFAALVIVVF